MKKLADILLAPQRKNAVISSCVKLIEDRVASRGGLQGVALKTGMAMLKAAKPGILERATARLLPEFAAALEPLHAEFRRSGREDFTLFLQGHAQRATDALLGVADAHVARSDSATIRSTYAKLRSGAAAEVLAVIPGLASLVGGYLE